MRRLLIAFLLGCGVVVVAQTPKPYIRMLSTWAFFGPDFRVDPGGQISVNFPAPPKVQRRSVHLAWDAAIQGWRLPAGATDVVLYVDTWRMHQGRDWEVREGIIHPIEGSVIPECQSSVYADFQE